MRLLVTARLAAVLSIIAGCGNDNGHSPSAGGKVSLDQGAAVHDSVTAAGKVLTATSHGVTYTLDIPAGAVQVPTVISMTPVTGIDGLGVTSLIGAVDLQPQGLVLGVPARLRIAAPHTAPSGTVLLAFGFEGDGDSLEARLPTDSAGGITISVSHFSGGGAAFATLGQIQTFLPHGFSPVSRSYVDSLFVLSLLDPRDFLGEQNLMREWFTVVVLPSAQNAGNDVALLRAVSEYNKWRGTGTPANLIPDDPLFANERAQFAAAALTKLQQAVAQNNTVCAADRDLAFANNVLYWQTVADELGLATVANGLDRTGVVEGLCLHILITDSSYPNPVQPQQTASLDLLAGVQYGNQPNLDPGLFLWRLDITGSTADGTVQGLSGADGSFTHVILPSGQASLVVAISACLNAPEVPYADVCATGNLVRNFECGLVLSGTVTLRDSLDIEQFRNVRELQGELIIQNRADLVMNFPCLQKVARLTITGGGPGILNLTALQAVDAPPESQFCCGFFDIVNTGLRFINLPALQLVGEAFDIQNNPQLTTVVISAVHVKERMSITGNPALTSLTLGAARIDQTLALSNNDALPGLGGVSTSIFVGQILAIEGNAGFTDSTARAFADQLSPRPPTIFIDTNGP